MNPTDIDLDQPPGVSPLAWRVIAAVFTVNLMAIGALLTIMTGFGIGRLENTIRSLPEPFCLTLCDSGLGGD